MPKINIKNVILTIKVFSNETSFKWFSNIVTHTQQNGRRSKSRCMFRRLRGDVAAMKIAVMFSYAAVVVDNLQIAKDLFSSLQYACFWSFAFLLWLKLHSYYVLFDDLLLLRLSTGIHTLYIQSISISNHAEQLNFWLFCFSSSFLLW